jgi:D-alanyl-D-alanine carboxypeptidase/D-alanyl-D-alanine-endopeptidase (penicillin-binding protein 4)
MDLPCLRNSQVGVRVARLSDGKVLFERGADLSLQPASTLKLLTAAAALRSLGPEFTFKTRFLSAARLEEGILHGDLIVKGGGAPDLTGERLWYAARALARLGLREVRGNLVADESYFDDERRPGGWPAPGVDRAYNAPVGALSFNFNVVSIEVRPGAAVGAPPHARLSPLGAGLDLVNAASTSASRSDLRVQVRRHNGRDQMVVRGGIRLKSPPLTLHRSLEDPAGYALGALRELMAREGVLVTGSLASGIAPEGVRELYVLESQPLSQTLFMMNKMSNNMMAESIVKVMGAQETGPPGTTASGLRVVRRFLEEIGVDTGSVRLADGSGLSKDNHLPAAALARVLEEMPRRFSVWPEFLASMPIGGVDGTLDDRMRGDLARRVRAKTGRVAGVATLAGYVSNEDGDTLAFAVFVNRVSCSYPRVVEQVDRLALALAGSRTAGPTAAGPAREAAAPSLAGRP